MRTPVLVTAATVLIATQLRPAVAGVGPLLQGIRADLNLSATAAANLVALPTLCFGLLAPIAPWLARRVGLPNALGTCLALMVAGLLLRAWGTVAMLFAGTVIVALGIAMANVLVPAWVKTRFGADSAVMMGVYTALLTTSSAVAAGLAVPLEHAVGLGWRGGLGVWVVPCVLVLVVWLPLMSRRVENVSTSRTPGLAILRDRVAWSVTVFFGLQAASFYAILAWLPERYQDAGQSAVTGGALLALSAIVQAPVALIVPVWAARLRRPTGLVVAAGFLSAIGLLAVLTSAPPVLSVVVLGVGQGASFSLALLMIVLRARTDEDATRLSAMTQTVGYLLAASGPLVVGAARDLTGGWTVGLILLVVLLLPQVIAGAAASRPRPVLTQD